MSDSRTILRDVVREYLQVHSAITAGSKAWHFMVPLDPGDMPINFFPKSQTQASELAFVVRNRIQQLGASFREELDIHREGKRPPFPS